MNKRDYILTYSGRMVSVSQDSVPSESDIALSLSRQPRFAGMTRRWWSVLDHSLYVAKLAILDRLEPRVVVAALLHDAHEFTGDIPTPFKTSAQREMQQAMDKQIFMAYMPGGHITYGERAGVKALDERALLAEAYVVGPPALKTYKAVEYHFGALPLDRDVVFLKDGIDYGLFGVEPAMLAHGVMAPNVSSFLWLLQQYRSLANGPAVHIYPEETV